MLKWIPSLLGPLLIRYIGFLFLSVVLLCISAGIDNHDVYEGTAVLCLTIELFMYPIAILGTKASDLLPIDVHHNIERAELWAILVLGESMLSLVHGAEQYYMYADRDYYLNTVFAFSINFMLLKLFVVSQPEAQDHHGHKATLDCHAVDCSLLRSVFFDVSQAVVTSALFVYGVACKFVVKYGHYKGGYKFDETHCWLFSCSTACALFSIAASRFVHEWSDYEICGPITRLRLWAVHFVIALLIGSLPFYTVEREKVYNAKYPKGYTYTQSNLTVLEWMSCILACVMTSVVVDYISTFKPDEINEELDEFQAAMDEIVHGKIPTDINTEEQDAELLSANTTVALALSRMRQAGSKKLRFSGKYMKAARKIRAKMMRDRDAVLEGASNEPRERLPSLLTVYQGELDKKDPTHIMGTQSNAIANWQKGAQRMSMVRKISSVPGVGSKKTNRVAPAVSSAKTLPSILSDATIEKISEVSFLLLHCS